MSEGKVKWFNTRKGYGFIATDDGADIFVHYSNIAANGYKTLNEGDPVTFDIVEGEKGLRAENVVPKAAAKSRTVAKAESAPKVKEAPKRNTAPKSEAVESTEAEESTEVEESTEAEETEEETAETE